MQIFSVILIIIVSFGIILTIIKYTLNFYQFTHNQVDKYSNDNPAKYQFSVHIPTRGEPFEVVKNCIESIRPQLSEKDEILVIDNNHQDREAYQEIQQYCAQNNIFFEHHDFIPGFKAGAMNHLLKSTNNETTHIIVIDCDYMLEKDAIETIRENLDSYQNYKFLQFPQAYKDGKTDIKNELNKYFNFNLRLPLNQKNTLGTGTLCIIDYNFLKSIEGWPTNSITEDALFGVKCQENDGNGVFINKIIGKGMTPSTIKDFINQRKRWVYGNAQVLYLLIKKFNLKTFKQSNISQLATWLNFTSLTVIVHLISLILLAFQYNVSSILFYLIYTHYALVLIFKMIEFSHLKLTATAKIKALLINWGTFWISTFYWIPVIFGLSRDFIPTPKIVALKKNYAGLPILFTIGHILTLIAVRNSPLLFIIVSAFLLIDILSKYIYIQNYKL